MDNCEDEGIPAQAGMRAGAVMPLVHILWDDAHIWGLLAVRALRAMAIPYRLTCGADISRGLLERERPSLLLVPGGNARHKAESLGRSGLEAIRAYVNTGGSYLGFCGGAGLALTWEGNPESLGLCPWRRAGFEDRMQHFMSGHLRVVLSGKDAGEWSASAERCAFPPQADASSDAALLPVWWPGRFAPESGNTVSVLASYERPGDDFWLADLPVADLPADIFTAWKDLYGLTFTPDFLAGQPCIIHGHYGRGQFVLSYSHLETPDSPYANGWFAHLLHVLGDLSPANRVLPPWRPHEQEAAWEDAGLDQLARQLETLRQTGLNHGQLFCRTDWLMGWRTGIPGANLNNLWALLSAVRAVPPAEAARKYWLAQQEKLLAAAELFVNGSIQYLLAERLAMTLAKSLPSALPTAMLKNQRESLFGPPMHAGGLYREIIEPLDRLAYWQLA